MTESLKIDRRYREIRYWYEGANSTHISTLTLSRVLNSMINRPGEIFPRRYSHHHLPSNRANLDLDIDNAERLGADVNLDQTWVDRLVELPKSRNKTDRACEVNCRN